MQKEKSQGVAIGVGKQRQYLVAASWGHCFVGSKESIVRWVLEIGAGVVAGQVLNAGRWHDMHKSEIDDVQEEIDDNSIVENYGTEHDGQIVLVEKLPFWAQQPTSDFVSVDDALRLIATGSRVHTFTVMMGRHGCDIDRSELQARIVQAGGAMLSERCGLGHELMIEHEGEEIFIECDAKSLASHREQIDGVWPFP